MIPARTASLVLVDPERRLVGTLPPFEADVPWWQECGDVVRLARDLHGVDVVVLRLLRTERPSMPGGLVVYLRHATTDRSKEDDVVVELDDCSTQRNLSEQGRDQSRTIGRAFRALEIPIGANMVAQPRTNPYVRMDGWDEEVAKIKAAKKVA